MRKYVWARVEVYCDYDDSHQSDGCPTAAFSDISPPELCKTCGYSDMSEADLGNYGQVRSSETSTRNQDEG